MTIPYIGSTRETLYQEIKRLEGLGSSGEECSAICEPRARRHLRYGPQGWTFLESKKPLGVLGVRITYCPFCGKRLQG